MIPGSFIQPPFVTRVFFGEISPAVSYPFPGCQVRLSIKIYHMGAETAWYKCGIFHSCHIRVSVTKDLSLDEAITVPGVGNGGSIGRHRKTPFRSRPEILDLPHGTKVRAAGLLESLQRPPPKSGQPVYFLIIEDESGLLQATIFKCVYARYGHILHREGAFLLEGVVEQDIRRGFSFLVRGIEGLGEILAGNEVPAPRARSSSGTFLMAGRGGERKTG